MRSVLVTACSVGVANGFEDAGSSCVGGGSCVGEASCVAGLSLVLSVLIDKFFMERPAAEGLTREDEKRRGLRSQLYRQQDTFDR